MLREYALSPRVFDPAAYASAREFKSVMGQLYRELQRHGLVRNLRDGAWLAQFNTPNFRQNLIARKIVEALEKRKRLIPAGCYLPAAPRDDREWTEEALLGHDRKKAFGIIATHDTAAFFPAGKIVAAATALDDAAWWNGRSDTATIGRAVENYLATFRPVFRYSRSLVFVDPYLDTRKVQYRRSISEILRYIAQVNRDCRVEFVTQFKDREDTGVERAADLKALNIDFRLKPVLKLVPAAFFNRYEHERFLVSDLASFSLTNGFDADLEPPRMMTVCLLEDSANEDLQRAIDQACGVSACRHFNL